MTVKFIEQVTVKHVEKLGDLKAGSAFLADGTYYIVSDEKGDAPHIRLCMNVSSEIGYLAHLDNSIEVEPVTLIISKEE